MKEKDRKNGGISKKKRNKRERNIFFRYMLPIKAGMLTAMKGIIAILQFR